MDTSIRGWTLAAHRPRPSTVLDTLARLCKQAFSLEPPGGYRTGGLIRLHPSKPQFRKLTSATRIDPARYSTSLTARPPTMRGKRTRLARPNTRAARLSAYAVLNSPSMALLENSSALHTIYMRSTCYLHISPGSSSVKNRHWLE